MTCSVTVCICIDRYLLEILNFNFEYLFYKSFNEVLFLHLFGLIFIKCDQSVSIDSFIYKIKRIYLTVSSSTLCGKRIIDIDIYSKCSLIKVIRFYNNCVYFLTSPLKIYEFKQVHTCLIASSFIFY